MSPWASDLLFLMFSFISFQNSAGSSRPGGRIWFSRVLRERPCGRPWMSHPLRQDDSVIRENRSDIRPGIRSSGFCRQSQECPSMSHPRRASALPVRKERRGLDHSTASWRAGGKTTPGSEFSSSLTAQGSNRLSVTHFRA